MRLFRLKKIVADYAAELKNNSEINEFSEWLSAPLSYFENDALLSIGGTFLFFADIVEKAGNSNPSFRDFCRTNEFAMPAYVAEILHKKGALSIWLYLRSLNSQHPELTAYAYANFFEHLNGEMDPDAIDELITELCKKEVKLPCFVGQEILIDPDIFHVTKPPKISKWVTYNPSPYEFILSLLDIDPNFLREPGGLRITSEIMLRFGTWGAGILLSSENLSSLKNSVNFPETLVTLENLYKKTPFDQPQNHKKVTHFVSVISRLNHPLESASMCIELTKTKNRWDLKNGNMWLHEVAKWGYAPLAMEMLDVGVDINVKNKEGKTPLHIAAENGSVDIVNCLLSRGAHYKITDISGKTALDYVQEKMGALNQNDEKIKERYQSIFLHLSAQIKPERPAPQSFLFQPKVENSEELEQDAASAPSLDFLR